MKKIVKCFISIILTLTVSISCNGQKTNNNNTMNDIIIHETKDVIKYLVYIRKYDNLKYGSDSDSNEENFGFSFDINTHFKSKPEMTTNARYTMHVSKVDSNYKTKFRLESETFCEDGKNVGHIEPSGEWYTDDGLSDFILNYYFSHQEIIPVHTKNIDISQWEPLFCLYENTSNQSHVLKISINKLYPTTGHFELDCELLNTPNVLVNGELINYSISTHTLLFHLRGKEYYVSTRHNSTKTYTNGGKDVIELTVPNQYGETRPANESMFSRKVLEYYLNHKSELEMNMEIPTE